MVLYSFTNTIENTLSTAYFFWVSCSWTTQVVVCFSDDDDGSGDGDEHIPVDEPLAPSPLPSLSTLLHELMQGLLAPWTHRDTPDSSSGGRIMSSRPYTFQTFLHGIFGRDRWRAREARYSWPDLPQHRYRASTTLCLYYYNLKYL